MNKIIESLRPEMDRMKAIEKEIDGKVFELVKVFCEKYRLSFIAGMGCFSFHLDNKLNADDDDELAINILKHIDSELLEVLDNSDIISPTPNGYGMGGYLPCYKPTANRDFVLIEVGNDWEAGDGGHLDPGKPITYEIVEKCTDNCLMPVQKALALELIKIAVECDIYLPNWIPYQSDYERIYIY